MSWEGSFGTQERGRDMVWTKRIDTPKRTRTWTIKLEDPTKKWVVSPARESKLKGLVGGIFQPYLTLNPCKTNWLECWRWLKDKERQGHVSSCRTLSNVDSPTTNYHYLYQIFRFAVCLFSLFCLDVVSNCLGGDSSCSAWGKPSDSSKSFMSLARAHDSDIPDNTWQYQFQFSHIHSLVSPNSLATWLSAFSEWTLKHIKTLQRKRFRTKVSQVRLELIKGELSGTIVVHLVTASHSGGDRALSDPAFSMISVTKLGETTRPKLRNTCVSNFNFSKLIL